MPQWTVARGHRGDRLRDGLRTADLRIYPSRSNDVVRTRDQQEATIGTLLLLGVADAWSQRAKIDKGSSGDDGAVRIVLRQAHSINTPVDQRECSYLSITATHPVDLVGSAWAPGVPAPTVTFAAFHRTRLRRRGPPARFGSFPGQRANTVQFDWSCSKTWGTRTCPAVIGR